MGADHSWDRSARTAHRNKNTTVPSCWSLHHFNKRMVIWAVFHPQIQAKKKTTISTRDKLTTANRWDMSAFFLDQRLSALTLPGCLATKWTLCSASSGEFQDTVARVKPKGAEKKGLWDATTQAVLRCFVLRSFKAALRLGSPTKEHWKRRQLLGCCFAKA